MLINPCKKQEIFLSCFLKSDFEFIREFGLGLFLKFFDKCCCSSLPTVTVQSVAIAIANQILSARSGSLKRVFCHCHPSLFISR